MGDVSEGEALSHKRFGGRKEKPVGLLFFLTLIGVKPGNIDEVKQSIAIRIGTIRTVAHGT